MIKKLLGLSCMGLLLWSTATQAQNSSIYDYTEAFNPIFYTQNGTPYRSANGKPGHAYWQNSADYAIKVSLDDKTDGVAGKVTITYTNNSPDELSFIWLQLDQNLFHQDSRGQAVVPLEDSRYGSASS